MTSILLIDDDLETLTMFQRVLEPAGHRVVTVDSGSRAIQVLIREPINVVISDLRLPDMSGIEVLKSVRQNRPLAAFVLVTGYANTRDTVNAMRLGAIDVIEKPLSGDKLMSLLNCVVYPSRKSDVAADGPTPSAHAAARWARAVWPVVNADRDTRTVADWAHLIVTSIGALRNWCRTAGIGARRSLLFGRMLRVVSVIERDGLRKPENLLDVVDRRTVAGMLKLAGIDADTPTTVAEFLNRQVLVLDREALREITCRLSTRDPHIPNPVAM